MTEKEITKFNSNSKEFMLGWSHVHANAKDRSDPPPSGILSDRGNKFIQKSPKELSKKVGSPEVSVRTPLLSPQITRNERQRSTFYIGDYGSKTKSTICPMAKTTEEWSKMDQKHQAAKTDRIRKKKEEMSKLEDQKWSRLKKKLLQREPFRF